MIDIGTDVARWQQLKRSVSLERFAAEFAHPFLLRRRPSRPSLPPGNPNGVTKEMGFETGLIDSPYVARLPPEGQLAGARVLAVVKAQGNPYPDRVAVGRAGNCDIVLRDVSVSKLHAHLRVLGPGEATVTDAGSVNGTLVNGKRLAAGTAQPLRVGDTVAFGGIVTQFLDPRTLYELL
jgi:hypothetical protein